jgi:sugar phosphate isomerase/epimerase
MGKNIKFCAFADEASSKLCGQIVALQRNGLELLEIRGVDGKNIADITADEAKEIKKRLDDGGIRVWSSGSPIGKVDIHLDFAAELERFKRTLETAVILGAENMRMFSFYKTSEGDIDEIVDRIGAFLDVANGSGVDLCHENEKGIFGDIPEKCALLHKQLPSLKAVFDPANFVQCGADTINAWSLLSPYVKYLHAKDADADGKVVPCGMGNGNVPYVFGEFSKMGGGVITLEPHLKSFVGLSALEGGDTSAVGGMSFASSDEAFDYAVNAAKNIADTL